MVRSGVAMTPVQMARAHSLIFAATCARLSNSASSLVRPLLQRLKKLSIPTPEHGQLT